MTSISTRLKFFLTLAKVQSLLTRKFDGGLGGLGFSEFMILYHLSQAKDEKLRRVDLALKIGLTASGVTRLLLPMEKIGLVNKESHATDARVSYVSLAPGGKRKFTEAFEDAELLAFELIPSAKKKKLEELAELLSQLSGTIS